MHVHSFLRSDALAQILSLSNVHARSSLLVMETTQGLLTGAMLERLGGTMIIIGTIVFELTKCNV